MIGRVCGLDGSSPPEEAVDVVTRRAEQGLCCVFMLNASVEARRGAMLSASKVLGDERTVLIVAGTLYHTGEENLTRLREEGDL